MNTAIITGATSGFGSACAKKFAKTHKLVLMGRRLERLEELKTELSQITKVHLLNFDIRDKEQIRNQINSLPSDFQDYNVLINNAGLALGLELANEAKLENWDQMIDTNITALVHMTRNCLPNLIQQESSSIINIGSIAGSWPYPGGNTYGATKAFVAQFSRNLRADLLGTGVRVCNIEPGLAETEFSMVRFGGDNEKAKSVYEGLTPLYANDIAEQCFWVASQPPHININSLEIMPTSQAWGPLAVSRS